MTPQNEKLWQACKQRLALELQGKEPSRDDTSAGVKRRLKDLEDTQQLLCLNNQYLDQKARVLAGANLLLEHDARADLLALADSKLSAALLEMPAEKLARTCVGFNVATYSRLSLAAKRVALATLPLVQRSRIVHAICPIEPLQLFIVTTCDQYGHSTPRSEFVAPGNEPEASAFVSVTAAPEATCRQIAADDWTARLYQQVDRVVFDLAAGHGTPLMGHPDAPDLPSLGAK